MALAFVLALGSGIAVAKKDAMMGNSQSGMTCPAGSKWVNGYKTKAGKTIKGYCRATKRKKDKM